MVHHRNKTYSEMQSVKVRIPTVPELCRKRYRPTQLCYLHHLFIVTESTYIGKTHLSLAYNVCVNTRSNCWQVNLEPPGRVSSCDKPLAFLAAGLWHPLS